MTTLPISLLRCAYCGNPVTPRQREAPELPTCGPSVLVGLMCEWCGAVQRGGGYVLPESVPVESKRTDQ